MFSRTSLFYAFSSCAVLAAATATTTVTVTAPSPTPFPASQCNTGGLQCCNSVQASDLPVVATLLGLLGIDVGGISIPIGLTCSPLTIIGTGQSDCTAQPVCCTNNSFNGLVAIGCTPINLSL